MKNRKPTYSEKKAQLKAALEETARRLDVAKAELDQLEKQGMKYMPDKEPPKTFAAKLEKTTREIRSLQLNLTSIKNTMRSNGMTA